MDTAAPPTQHLLFIDGAFRPSDHQRTLHAPHGGAPVAIVHDASAAQLQDALAAAEAALPRFRATSRYTRSRLLAEIARGTARRRADLVTSIVDEAGKPSTLADAEVSRAVTTFTIAAEEAKRYGGELFPVDIDAAGRAYDL